jgi:sugar lactone lactonase YvrE
VHLEVALTAADELGEGPWWSVADGCLWRVDIRGRLLHRWQPLTGDEDLHRMPSEIGFAVPTTDQKMVAGLRQGISLFDPADGSVEVLDHPAPERPEIRFNDGKTDRAGRLWAGTLTDDEREPTAALHRLSDDGSLATVVDGIVVSNGLGWSPDGLTMYYTDSGPQTIWAFDFDPDAGRPHNRRVFAIDVDRYPDGLTVDAEGGVWSAKWDGSRVVRYDPDGSVSAVIDAPVSRPTSCMFGGPGLSTLYVTSARVGLDPAELAATPAGCVLAVEPGVAGIPEVPWRGLESPTPDSGA